MPPIKYKAVVLLGPIAPPHWGPAVKNRIMLDTFRAWGMHIVPLNTLAWKSRPFGFFVDVVQNSWRLRRVILSVSRNGRFLLLPLLAILGVFRRIHIVFIPAGGIFARDLESLPRIFQWLYVVILQRLDLICVQRPELAQQLQALNLPLPLVMPNFKVCQSELPPKSPRGCPKLLFLSRIRKVKGIEPLFEALDILTARGFHFCMDFYGIMQPDYESKFRKMLNGRSYAAYCGVIEYSQVIPTISDYDLMIFSTLVETEGFPGVLADAAMAGLPVVASDVPSNREIIENGVNGLLAKPGDPGDLAAIIERLLSDSELRTRLAANNRLRARSYDVDVVLKMLVHKLEALGWWT